MTDNKQKNDGAISEPDVIADAAAETSDEFTVPQPDHFESGVPRDESNGFAEQDTLNLTPQGFNERLKQGQNSLGANSKTTTEEAVDLSQGKLNLSRGITIKTKLIASLSILTLIILVLGIVSFTTILEINDFSLSITDEHAALARVTEEVKSSVYVIRDAEKDFLLLEEQEAQARSSRGIAKLRNQLEKATVLGTAISESTGINIGSQYQSLNDAVDNYEQLFARQTRDVRSARDDINKAEVEALASKKLLIEKIDVLRDQIRNMLDDFWIDSKRLSRLATQKAEGQGQFVKDKLKIAIDKADALLAKDLSEADLFREKAERDAKERLDLAKATAKATAKALQEKQKNNKDNAIEQVIESGEEAREQLSSETSIAIELLSKGSITARQKIVTASRLAVELLASNAQESSLEAIDTTVIESKRIVKSLELGVLMADIERGVLQMQVQVARYLQLNQQLYADAAISQMNSIIDTAESIRQLAEEESLVLAMKETIRGINGYMQLFRSSVTTINEVEARKLRVDQNITAQKAQLKAGGENLIALATQLSGVSWSNVKQQSLQLREAGSSAQFVLLIVALIGSIIGIAVLILVPKPILLGINQLLAGAQRVASGNLTQPISVSSNDELGQLAVTFDHMRINLLGLVDRIQKASVQITTTVNEIQAAANQQASTANEQSAAISQFTATMGEIAQTAEQLSHTANVLSEGAGNVSDSMTESGKGAGQTLESMNAIGDSTRQTSERIKALNDQMDGINDAVTTIASVADQTTLLSLNAAIEANKAGEMGKGFSVVATEIRRLSDRSIESANGIGLMVRDIQRATESSVVSMDKSAEEIRQGISLVKQSTDTMVMLNERVSSIRQQTLNISSGSMEQAQGSREAQSSVSQLLSSAELAAQAARQTSGAAFELSAMATQLADAVAVFKT